MHISTKKTPKPFDPSVAMNGVLGILLTATLFFSGELNERSGAFAVLAVLWILAAAVRSLFPLLQKEKVPFHVNGTDVGVYSFFGFVVLSILWNLLPGQGGAPRPSLNMLAVWLGLAAAWFLFRQTLNTSQRRNAALRLVLAVVVAQAATGLYQQFVEHPQLLRQFEADPVRVIAQVDRSIAPDTPEWDRLAFRLKTAGPTGTFPLTNTLGGLLATGLILMLGILLKGEGSREQGTEEVGGNRGQGTGNRFSSCSLFPAPSLLIMVVSFCFVLTKCRSGFVAVAVGLFLLGIVLLQRLDRSWRQRLLLCGGIVCALFLAVTLLLPGKPLLDGAKRSLGFRLEYWQASLGMIRDYPIFGCGSGNFKQTYMQYKLPGSSEEIADPHNFAVELAAIAGVPGLVLFVLPVGWVIVRSLRKRETVTETPPKQHEKILYWSSLGGGALAFLVSLNAEAQIEFAPLLFLLLAVPLVAWAFPSEREVSPGLLAITLTVLFVHLLAAGGISATNTAIVVWLLIALLVKEGGREQGTGNRRGGREQGAGNRKQILFLLPVPCSLPPLLFVVSLLVVNHYCLRPVIGAFSYTIRLDDTPDVSRRVALLREATTVDPWSADIREKTATELFSGWFRFPQDEQWKTATIAAQDQALRLSPRSAGLRYVFAERLFMMYEKTGDKTLQNQSLELFAEAVERYPNHAKFRAPFALALWKSGHKAEAIEQRDAALHLDDVMHHVDQKLPEKRRNELSALGE